MHRRTVARGLEGCKRPPSQLKLYESHHATCSRIVRETLDTLDLDALVLPCPEPSVHSLATRLLSAMLHPLCCLVPSLPTSVASWYESLGVGALRGEVLKLEPQGGMRFAYAAVGSDGAQVPLVAPRKLGH
ncbi:MAG: hypothetical protein SGPRY_010414 [Prymnesium sp.]